VFIGDQVITGSYNQLGEMCVTGNITSTGQIIAQTINVQQVTSSIVYSCGSNTFGCSVTNNQVFTGSVFITGSNIIANVITTCFQGSLRSCNLFIQSPSTAEVVDILRLNNPAVASSGTRLKFENGYGDLAAIRVIHRDNGALADDGQIEFQVGSNASLDTKMTILNTGQIGMGTLSPSAELQVNKNCDTTIAISNCVGVTSGNRGTLAWYNCATSTVAMIRAAAVTDNVGTELQFHTRPSDGNLTQRMTLSSSGNLGIGETSPEDRLVVCGGSIVVKCTTYPSINLYTTSGTNWGITNRYTGNRLSIDVIGTGEVVNILSNGNVGIGTLCPNNLLHVYGTDGNSYIRWTSNVATTGTRIGYNGTEFRIDQQQNGNISFRTNGSERSRITCGGDLILGLADYDPKFYMTSTGGIGTNERFYIDGYAHGDGAGYGGGFRLYTRDTVNVFHQRLTVDSSGNVGIGATNPSQKFVVYSDVSAIASFYSTTNFGELQISAPTTNEISLQGGTGDAMTFYTGACERIRITSSGNVGIRSNSPRATLHVQQSSNDGTPVIGTARDGAVFTSNNGNYGLNITVDPVGMTHLQAMRFDSQSVGYNLILQPSACNVGIGTTGPGARLHIRNLTGGNTPSNYLQIEGAIDNNDNYPSILLKGGTLATTYPSISLSNGGLALTLSNGISTLYNNPAQISVNNGVIFFSTGDNALSTERMRIEKNGLILSCGRMSSIMASSGNIQEWVGLTGSIANNTGWSLFSIANQYDNLSMDIYVFTDVGSFQGSKHEVVMSYTQFVNSGIGYSSAFCIFRTGTLYNETMTICNLSGSNINSQRIAIRVWGYGVGQNGTGGSNLLNTSCLTRIK
jgi:hypothetical protein